jgi:predicted esterase
MRILSLPLLLILLVLPTLAAAQELPAIPPIKRLLPPYGNELSPEVRAVLEKRLQALERSIAKLENSPQLPDVEIFTKAVSCALKFDEFYTAKDVDKVHWALAQAAERLSQFEQGKALWAQQTGLVVRGYRSRIDDSVQPYGLVIPENHDFKKPCPLYVWLHGRGDKATDLHFIHGRAQSVGELAPPDAIVLHPFGRNCLGFKSAGEIDVLEAVAAVQQQYQIDSHRIVLIGFSMGGAGAWHLGAHYADHWCAVAPGAGFAETARYQNLKPENYPPQYEQTLWGVYDVPDYVRNLFNVPVIAYSGEVDKQIQAARVMEEAYANEGHKLTHLIGPGMGHKYHPEVKQDLLARLAKIAAEADGKAPDKVSVQTRTLRYGSQYWVQMEGLVEHWQDSRIDADWPARTVATKNVSRLKLNLAPFETRSSEFLTIDGDRVLLPQVARGSQEILSLVKIDGHWQVSNSDAQQLRKRPHLQGPIDDAFLGPVLVVLPTGKSSNPRIAQWVDFESQHQLERWQAAFRGKLKTVTDQEVTAQDLQRHNIILWGDPESNAVIRQVIDKQKLPLAWNAESLELGEHKLAAATHLPALIYPSPFAADRYVVLNSGPTFREAHDRTNSLQNPKLPDWALLDITTPPDAAQPGRVIAADFFDEAWQVKPRNP